MRPTRPIPTQDEPRAPPPAPPPEDDAPATRREEERPRRDPKVDFSVDVSFSCYV